MELLSEEKPSISDKIFTILAYVLLIAVYTASPLAIILLRKRRRYVIFHCFQAYILGILGSFIIILFRLATILNDGKIVTGSLSEFIIALMGFCFSWGSFLFLIVLTIFGLSSLFGLKIKIPFIGNSLEKIVYEKTNEENQKEGSLPTLYKSALCYPLSLFAILIYTSEKKSKTVKFHALQAVFLFSLWISAILLLGAGMILFVNNELVVTLLFCLITFVAFSYLFIQWFMIRKTLNKEIYQLPLIGKQALKTISKQVD